MIESELLESWLSALANKHGDEAAQGAHIAVIVLTEEGYELAPSASGDSLQASVLRGPMVITSPFGISLSDDAITLNLQYLRYTRAYKDEIERLETAKRFIALGGEGLRWSGSIEGFPAMKPRSLLNDGVTRRFTNLAAEVKERLVPPPGGRRLAHADEPVTQD